MAGHPGGRAAVATRKHLGTVPLVPASVRAARERSERSLALFGPESSSALFAAGQGLRSDVRIGPSPGGSGTVAVRFILPEGTP
ncbi:hypothetical protein WDV06_15325 [Streptomyces racemochromogenes]|uniref:Uncharacterized protein n=1 Tax=Streptomyces racemochromogenes TaxID=67353 RepID=A0ABW7PDK5_9ACTN